MAQRYRANRQIRVPEVRVVGDDGNQLGIMPTERAVEIAMQSDLDLVEVAPNARPPVCRIMDYGKFKYDKKKRSKKKPHQTKVKEVRFRPKTDDHDYAFKLKRLRGFIGEGHRCVVTVLFRGREMAFKDRGRAILSKVVEDVADVAKPEQSPRFEGRRFNMVLLPLKVPAQKSKKSERVKAVKPSGRQPAASESKEETASPATPKPAEPAEPVKPAEPVEPAEPVKPAEPVEPAETPEAEGTGETGEGGAASSDS